MRRLERLDEPPPCVRQAAFHGRLAPHDAPALPFELADAGRERLERDERCLPPELDAAHELVQASAEPSARRRKQNARAIDIEIAGEVGFERTEPAHLQDLPIDAKTSVESEPRREGIEPKTTVLESTLELLPGERDRLLEIGRTEKIDLVQDDEQLLHVPPYTVEEVELRLARRLVCAEDEDDGVGLGQEVERDGRVRLVHGSDPRYVDEPDPGTQERGGVVDFDALDALCVGGVATLGRVGFELIESDVVAPPISETDASAWTGAVPDDGHHRSERNDGAREDARPDQRVDKRRLPPLELAHHREVEVLRGELASLGVQTVNERLLTERASMARDFFRDRA